MPSKPADKFVRKLIADKPNTLVPQYLIHSYLYYRKDVSIITDGLYDEICLRLYKEWGHIDHPHKGRIDRATLKAGTGYQLKYPSMVKGAAKCMATDFGLNVGYKFHGR